MNLRHFADSSQSISTFSVKEERTNQKIKTQYLQKIKNCKITFSQNNNTNLKTNDQYQIVNKFIWTTTNKKYRLLISNLAYEEV